MSLVTTEDLLDLHVGQRSSDVRFDLLDGYTLEVIGTVDSPDLPGPTISLDVTRRVNRTLSGVHLSPSVQSEINQFADRLRPVWILQNGAEFPLGVFLFGSMDRKREEWGIHLEGAEQVDQTIIVDQATGATVNCRVGRSIRDCIIEQLTAARLSRFTVDEGIYADLTAAISWPAGTKRLDIVNELATLGGAYPLYFDNGGTGQVRVAPDPETVLPTHFYTGGGRILAGSMIESDDLMDAPNRYIVIDSGNPDTPIVGYYDIPSTAPNSIVNRDGFVITRVISQQGLQDTDAAKTAARIAYESDPGSFETVSFASPPDPRHDTYDTVSYLDGVYEERGWSLPLSEGSDMTHNLRRLYQPDVAE